MKDSTAQNNTSHIWTGQDKASPADVKTISEQETEKVLHLSSESDNKKWLNVVQRTLASCTCAGAHFRTWTRMCGQMVLSCFCFWVDLKALRSPSANSNHFSLLLTFFITAPHVYVMTPIQGGLEIPKLHVPHETSAPPQSANMNSKSKSFRSVILNYSCS